MNQLIIQAALATADNLEQRAKAIRAEVAVVQGKTSGALMHAIHEAAVKYKDKHKSSTAPPASKPKRKKRDLSPEARARIADAQKKRWAKFRKEGK